MLGFFAWIMARIGPHRVGQRVKLDRLAGLYAGQTGEIIHPKIYGGQALCVGSCARFNPFTMVMVRLDGPGKRTTVALRRHLEPAGGQVVTAGNVAPSAC